MGIAIVLGLFGAFLGVTIHNRIGAVLAAAVSAYVVWEALPAAQPFLDNSATGRRILALLAQYGGDDPSLRTLAAAAAIGVLCAWVLFGRRADHRPDWEWDPDEIRRRKRRRRRAHA